MLTPFKYDIITTVFTPLGGPAICRAAWFRRCGSVASLVSATRDFFVVFFMAD